MANPAKVKSVVREILSFGEGVYQVVFSVPRLYTRFRPGQFLHLTLDDFDPTAGFWPESRVFSISSVPSQDHVIIVYSVKGSYTRRMEEELVVGREVWLKLPYGDFVIDDASASSGPLVLIAGGTGVSPYWPFLLKNGAHPVIVHLYYGVRRPDHILFRDQLEGLVSSGWFQLHLMTEEGQVPELNAKTGRLSVASIVEDLGEQVPEAHYYLSGPPTMIQRFKDDLGGHGVDLSHIHIDSWE